MPLIHSAIKKMHQDEKRYARNLRTKRAMRSAIKAFEAKPSFDTMREAQSAIDTAAKKHVLSKQAAARRIAHVAHTAKEAGVKIPAKAAAKPAAKKSTAKKPAAKKTAAKSATK